VVALVRRACAVEGDPLIKCAGGRRSGSTLVSAAGPNQWLYLTGAAIPVSRGMKVLQAAPARELVRSVFYSINSCLFRNASDNHRFFGVTADQLARVGWIDRTHSAKLYRFRLAQHPSPSQELLNRVDS
jgi:hypothetical protein